MILLARHGETDDNVPPLRFQGQRDTPLNARGRAQAHELAERVAALDPPIASLWCSDLSRARETAEIVGARIGLEPRPDARLREGWRGEWEGFLFDEIAARDPERYAAWRNPDGEIGFRFPGGETLAQQQARVLEALAEIRADSASRRPATASGSPAGDESTALVVCHGGSIRTVLCASDPRGLAAFHTFEVPNVALVPVEQAVLR
ncbi:MAG: histidine phosphatase family protein [Actinobacteria bacterium]|nr:histidine phosphatase family protein [Actinomycetota bacterium]